MNVYGVLTIPEEFEERDDRSYETLKEEGVFELELKFRGWYRKAFSMGLICYFETADGKRCKLFCFRHTKNGEDQYRPKQISKKSKMALGGAVPLLKTRREITPG